MATLTEPSPAAATDVRGAFGLALSIDSRISIPGLTDAATEGLLLPPTAVGLAEGAIEERWSALSGAPQRARELRVGDEVVLSVDHAQGVGYLMWAQGFGRVLISDDGLELRCEPDPTNEEWASILAAQALPLAATVRGFEVLHASGVVLDGRALLMSGRPGAGKSSLAAALLGAGARLLSDDAVALKLVGEDLLAYPGSTVLQLRASEDELHSHESRGRLGRSLGAPSGKQRYLNTDVPAPAPLKALFLLSRSDRQPAVQRLDAASPFEVIASTFNLSVRTPARMSNQLEVVSALLERGLVHRLRVQPEVDASTLARMLTEHLA